MPAPGDLPWLRTLYLDEHRHHLRLVPPAPKALALVGSLPLHRGLISDIDHEFLTFVRDLFPLDRYLQSFTTSEEVGATKPDPRIFLAAVAKAGCSPAEAVHMGDLPEKDIRGAKAAGLTAILVGPAADDGEADHRVGDILEAVTLVADLVGRD
jgi:HAD superfamily hydrolase (TIGR01509 family)